MKQKAAVRFGPGVMIPPQPCGAQRRLHRIARSDRRASSANAGVRWLRPDQRLDQPDHLLHLASSDGARKITVGGENMIAERLDSLPAMVRLPRFRLQTTASTMIADGRNLAYQRERRSGASVFRFEEVLDPGRASCRNCLRHDLTTGTGNLVDANHGDREPRNFRGSPQVKQQLGVQALEIANQSTAVDPSSLFH